MKDIKVIGITVRLRHKDHDHEITYLKNEESGKYEVWIDKKLVRLAGLFSIIHAKRILSKHLNNK